MTPSRYRPVHTRTNVDDHHRLGLSNVRAIGIAHDATLSLLHVDAVCGVTGMTDRSDGRYQWINIH